MAARQPPASHSGSLSAIVERRRHRSRTSRRLCRCSAFAGALRRDRSAGSPTAGSPCKMPQPGAVSIYWIRKTVNRSSICARAAAKPRIFWKRHRKRTSWRSISTNSAARVKTCSACVCMPKLSWVMAHPQQWCGDKQFDRILLDAPCSATGVIRRHPDIKWLRRDRDIAELAALQAEIRKPSGPI